MYLPCDDGGFEGPGSSIGAWLAGIRKADPGPGNGLGLGSGALFRSICDAGFVSPGKKSINLYYHVSTTGSMDQLGRLAPGSSAMKGQNRGLAAASDSGALHNLDPHVTLGSTAASQD